MGLKPKDKKKHKEKAKRKRGKKFVYATASPVSKDKKANPFESISKKKFFKAQSSNYTQLVSEYKARNSTNVFIDKRIGENSKLSQEEKLKLRFKAQQLLKTNKKKKFLLNEDETNEEITLTHKGRPITEDNIENIQPEEDDEYYDKMHNYIEGIESKAHMTKAERFKAIVEQSKKMKQEKHQAKEENENKIEELDEGFAELSSMLRKRGRTFGKFNDDYDKYAANFIYADKVYPTERVKTQEEIDLENEMKIKKQNLKRLKEEAIEDEEEDRNGVGVRGEKNEADGLGGNAKQMTKKERIEKLINERLNKTQKIKESMVNDEKEEEDSNDKSEEEGDDNSDLDEFDSNNEEDEGEEGEGDDEDEKENDDNLSDGEEENDGALEAHSNEGDNQEEEDEDVQFLKKLNKKKKTS